MSRFTYKVVITPHISLPHKPRITHSGCNADFDEVTREIYLINNLNIFIKWEWFN
jgi:hypothetical protein